MHFIDFEFFEVPGSIFRSDDFRLFDVETKETIAEVHFGDVHVPFDYDYLKHLAQTMAADYMGISFEEYKKAHGEYFERCIEEDLMNAFISAFSRMEGKQISCDMEKDENGVLNLTLFDADDSSPAALGLNPEDYVPVSEDEITEEELDEDDELRYFRERFDDYFDEFDDDDPDDWDDYDDGDDF